MDTKEFRFVEGVKDAYLIQHISKPTRRRGNDRPTLVDLILTRGETQIASIEHLAPLGKSDHDIIEVGLVLPVEEKETTFYNYNKGDYQRIAAAMQRDWAGELADRQSITEKWEYFERLYHTAVEEAVPTKTTSNRRKFKKPLSQKTRKLIKTKDKLWKKYKATNNPSAHLEYKRQRNKVRRATRKEAKQHERNIARDVKVNPKRFWNHVKQKTALRTGICDLMKPNGETTTNSKDKADTLAQYFSTVYISNPTSKLNFPNRCDDADSLRECAITEDMVKKKLKDLKIFKSPGPDSIHPRVLKETKDTIATPLAIIFNASLQEGKLPETWKTAIVSAIFKKGDRKQASNYRPVSLTSIACKVMESILRERIMIHLNSNNLISNKQYGFLPGRSTTLQLLMSLDAWTSTLDEGREVDVVYCDFMKAFDRVPHL
jgi:hypothetical protein